MLFPWPNPGLNVSKLFNELVRVPRMAGKLIIVEKPSARPRTCDVRVRFSSFNLSHRSPSTTAHSREPERFVLSILFASLKVRLGFTEIEKEMEKWSESCWLITHTF